MGNSEVYLLKQNPMRPKHQRLVKQAAEIMRKYHTLEEGESWQPYELGVGMNFPNRYLSVFVISERGGWGKSYIPEIIYWN